MKKPHSVSVVMSVYDQAELARMSIDSVLAQDEIELEFIIVSDGATQAVLEVLDEIDDNRVRLIRQQNAGLTNALIAGCDMASADYIARLDAGDTMLAGRLKMQSDVLAKNPHVGIVSCWVRMFTIEGYYLHDVCHSAQALTRGLAATEGQAFISPPHASVMFRKSTYLQAGGYRPEFYFTQDCDLWTRMVRHADVASVDEYLTDCIFAIGGISGRYAGFQKQLLSLIVQRNALGQKVISDQEVFKQAEKLKPGSDAVNAAKLERFNTLYFIASVLSAAKSPHAREYWQQALKVNPFSVVARIRWLLSLAYTSPAK